MATATASACSRRGASATVEQLWRKHGVSVVADHDAIALGGSGAVPATRNLHPIAVTVQPEPCTGAEWRRRPVANERLPHCRNGFTP